MPDLEEFWVRFQDRKSHAPVAQIDNFIEAEFAFNWRTVGPGKIKMQIRQLPRDALALLIDGDLGVRFHRSWIDDNGKEQTEDWLGFATGYQYKWDRFISVPVDFSQVINEPIILGPGDTMADRVGYRIGGSPATPDADDIFQVKRAESFGFHGLREAFHDKRELDTAGNRQTYWQLYVERGHYARPNLDSLSQAGQAAGGQITIQLQDVLGYLLHRRVDSSMLSVFDPSQIRFADAALRPTVTVIGVGDEERRLIAAERYIYDLMQREILDPEDDRSAPHGNKAYRKIDVDISPMRDPDEAGVTPHGEGIQLPVRWGSLHDAIEDACEIGRVGLTYELDGRRFRYTVEPERDRYSSSAEDRAIVSEAFADQEWNFRSGDRVAFAVWMSEEFGTPFSPIIESGWSGIDEDRGELCITRKLTVRPGQEVRERRRFGRIQDTWGGVINRLSQAVTQAQSSGSG